MVATPGQVYLGIEVEFMMANHKFLGEKRAKDKNVEKYRDGRFPDGMEPLPPDVDVDPFALNAQCMLRVCHAIAACGLPAAAHASSDPEFQDDDDDSIMFPGPRGSLVSESSSEQSEHHRYRVWNKDEAVNIESLEEAFKQGELRFGYWFVTNEYHISHQQWNDPIEGTPKGPYEWFAMELNSPIMDDTTALCKNMADIFTFARRNNKIWLNGACGMHIHSSAPVGVEILPLFVAKKVIALVALLEKPLIMKIVHPERKKSIYCRLISDDSRIAKESFGFNQQGTGDCGDIIRALEVFRGSDSGRGGRSKDEHTFFKTLLCLFNQLDMKRLAEGLCLYAQSPEGHSIDGGRGGIFLTAYGTLEFRYPHATVETGYISFWIDLIKTLYSIAQLSNKEYCEKIVKLYDMTTQAKGQRDWTEYLEVLGLSHRAAGLRSYVSQYSDSLKSLDKQPILPPVTSTAGRS